MTLDQFKQTYGDWKVSGLSVREYCNNPGVDEGKFYYWRRKLTDSALPDTQGFVPVRMNNLNGRKEHHAGLLKRSDRIVK